MVKTTESNGSVIKKMKNNVHMYIEKNKAVVFRQIGCCGSGYYKIKTMRKKQRQTLMYFTKHKSVTKELLRQ